MPHDLLLSAFDRFDLTRRDVLAAAVSGGSDSTALLLLLRLYLERRSCPTRLLAVTIDHELRAQSASEARAVATFCMRFGIRHRILSWTGAKPASNLSAAARNARYALLHRAAREAGTDILLTGHTLDDQIETIVMRAERGPGRGLAGMAPLTLHDGRIWIVRPFLETRRKALQDFLHREGVGWIDDPSNVNPHYERSRVRKALSQAVGDTGAPRVSPADIATAQKNRIRLSEGAAKAIRDHAILAAPGLYRIARPFFAAEPGEAARHAWRILLAMAGGTSVLPDQRRSDAIFETVARGKIRATLSRSLIDARRDHVWLCRERRGLPQPAQWQPGSIWDGRYRVGVSGSENFTIAPGGLASGANGPCAPNLPPRLAAEAAAVEPVLSAEAALEDAGLHVPSLTPVAAPWARFLPSFDLAVADAAARLVGGAKIPDPPCVGHKDE